jgi:hypothetical protein
MPPRSADAGIAPTLAAIYEAKLASSGLTLADARTLGFKALTPEQTQRLDVQFLKYPALFLPYTDLRGKATGFYRIRYLGELGGFDALRKKLPRYVQPADTNAEVYYPKLLDWPALAKDPNIALLVTEGELKAACGAKNGYPVIGLGGVWSWRAAKKGYALLPSLREITWKQRHVYLVFDSDFATKPQVMSALLALAAELTSAGAIPFLVTLPSPDDGVADKYGLDDFLVARGRDAFNAVMREAKPFSTSRELWALNDEVRYVRDPGLIVVLADGRKLAPSAFKEHAYANRHYLETTVNAQGEEKKVKKPVAKAWLEWESRAEVSRLTYAPGAPRITERNEYNYWPGWGISATPKRGDISLWTRLLDYLFAKDPAARVWFERWAAYPIAHPGTKLYTAAVMWGVGTGTGKSLVGYTLGALYGKNFTEIEDQHLESSFNEWAECKQFVMGDDVTSSENRRQVADRIKSMITREQLRLNLKYVPSFVIPDCVNYYFTSNHPDAFFIEDADRRYFVHEAPPDPLDRKFYDAYDVWYRSDIGRAALFHHLQHLDFGDFNPRAPALRTLAKDAMTLDTKSDLGAWVARLKESPETVLSLGGTRIAADLFTNDQLLALYDPERVKRVTANGLGRELKRAGFRQHGDGVTITTAKGPVRLYVVRNAARWVRAKPHDAAEHWNVHFAGAAADASKPKKEKY